MDAVMKPWSATPVILLLAGGLVLPSAKGQPAALPNEFFALDTAIVKNFRADRIQQADIQALAALGYPGLGVGVQNAAAWQHLSDKLLPWLDESKLKLYAVYAYVRVDRDKYSFDAELKQRLYLLKSRATIVWLMITSAAFKSSGPAADDLVVAAVRDAADAAAQQGLRVSLYPHVGLLVERVSDAVRIAEKVRRENVSVTLNLCHWLRTDGADSMERVMNLARPWLSLVTINGADRDGKEWIQPLDSGTLDVAAFLQKLHELGYRGPIGLQGFGVAGTYKIEPAENLRRSMAAWKKLSTLALSNR
jgi:sugar phosphate isomerase/epimerase